MKNLTTSCILFLALLLANAAVCQPIWKKISPFTGSNLNSAAFQGSSRAWIAGNRGVFNSSDGDTWNNVSLDTSQAFSHVQFFNPAEGIIIGSTKTYRTVNGGNAWMGFESPFNGPIPKISHPSKNAVFVSDGMSIYFTADLGQSWDTISPSLIGDEEIKDFHFINSNFGVVRKMVPPVTGGGPGPPPFNPGDVEPNVLRLLKTENRGLTWTTIRIPIANNTSFFMHFLSAQKGFLFGTEGKSWVTTNGGTSFSEIQISNIANGNTIGLADCKFVNENVGFVLSFSGRIFKTTDGGATWNLHSTMGIINVCRKLALRRNEPVLAIGNAGNVYRDSTWTDKYDHYASGKVVKSEDNDCVQDLNEEGLRNMVLVSEPGSYFVSTNNKGEFSIPVNPGVNTVSQIFSNVLPGSLISQFCPPADAGIPVSVNVNQDTIGNVNFINNAKLCPILNLSQSQRPLRPCMTSNLTVEIQNLGNIASDSEYVHINFPAQMHLVSASSIYDYNSLDSSYRFKIKPLQPFESISFTIVDSVNCNPNQLTGQTLCVIATIPNIPNCLLQSPGWDGADLEVASRCLPGSQTRFNIRNKGNAMPTTAQYQVYVDSALVYQSLFQLAANGSMAVTLPTNAPAGFARMVVPQSANHPLATFASAESNCATGLSTNGMFPPPDESPLVDIECITVTNAFDPNDKLVYPKGIGADGNVEPGTEFNYKIRFQNTGTDTAFKVVLVDTLDQNLDIASLQIGVASHPFTFKVTGKGSPVMTWTFKNIMLPDSNRNEQKSHGFVSFSIRPKASLALGTRLENFADIYFDFNDPIRTNTTVNTLWKPTLSNEGMDPVITSSQKLLDNIAAKVYPNPSKGILEVESNEQGHIEILNLQGATILLQKANKGRNQLNASALPKGLYLLKLENEQGVQTQKLVLE